jgi:hypothetical protein
MIFPNSSSDAIIEKIREQSGAWTPKQLMPLLEKARALRDGDFDQTCSGIAQRYRGDQQSILKTALKNAYSKTYEKMPIDPVNWLEFFATQDAGVYDVATKRELHDSAGEIDTEDERAIAFNRAIKQASIDTQVAELERISAAGARSGALFVGYRNIDGKSKAISQLYWPHQVQCLAHDSAPDDVDALWFVALLQSDTTKQSTAVWWCWSREFTEDDFGNLKSFGPWKHRRISEDGKIATAEEIYNGILPIAFFRNKPPDGGFWPSPNRDISVNVDSLNVARSNRKHIINMQAHSLLFYSGTMHDEKEFVLAPDAVFKGGAGETLAYIVPSANHDAIAESAKQDMSELAVSRGNSPDAYSTEPPAEQSGVSRIIANAPHQKRIAEQRPKFKDFEEQQLLPIIINVVELFDPQAPASFGDVKPVVTFGKNETFEPDSEKLDRVERMLLQKLIDLPDARVLLGLSSTREEAEKYLENMNQPTQIIGGLQRSNVFQSLRETTTPNTTGEE